MEIKKEVVVKGFPILGIATLMMLFARLFGYADISYWLVFAPILWPLYLIFGYVAIAFIFALIGSLL